MISGRFVDGLIEEVERFRDESAEVSVALGGRFEKSASPNSLSILTLSGATSRLAPNGLLSKGLRPAREGGGVEYSRVRLGVAADPALEDVG